MANPKDATEVVVLYNLLRSEIEAIEMVLESVRVYARSRGRNDRHVQEALAQIEHSLAELKENVERVRSVYAASRGCR